MRKAGHLRPLPCRCPSRRPRFGHHRRVGPAMCARRRWIARMRSATGFFERARDVLFDPHHRHPCGLQLPGTSATSTPTSASVRPRRCPRSRQRERRARLRRHRSSRLQVEESARPRPAGIVRRAQARSSASTLRARVHLPSPASPARRGRPPSRCSAWAVTSPGNGCRHLDRSARSRRARVLRHRRSRRAVEQDTAACGRPTSMLNQRSCRRRSAR